ncbi:hypothetical protein FHS16_001937 [Paenibacillus endophyticus]|uniref:Uncharacterized protein n=1 Tax=Paenibacillus endophyticus TaxID=1294268 RepID=A0A7W5C668_9BACL|nr:DUF6526 family protein [Paenibacillus endophyticus]MBB3151891.1 hypothetical protein [Paenibacillus endophyticus]
MANQHNGKSLRFHPPYHFVTLPLVMAVFVWSLINGIQALRNDGNIPSAGLFMLIAISLVFIAMIVRGYATKTQDRIIRLEEQFRHYRLTGQELDPALSIAQIIALRNADDKEFTGLCKRAVAEPLNPSQIRSQIEHWRLDSMRI